MLEFDEFDELDEYRTVYSYVIEYSGKVAIFCQLGLHILVDS